MGLIIGSPPFGGHLSVLVRRTAAGLPFRCGVVAGVLFALASGMAVVPATAAGAVPVPRGFQLMCLDHPSECRGSGAHEVTYDDNLATLLERVNHKVNYGISPVRNEVIDVWSVNATRGDCEEYVLAKRKALIKAGVPTSALSIVYVLRNGGGHAILAIHTDKGSFALDNMTGRIKSLYSTGYKLVSMSGPNPRVWQSLSPTLVASK